MVGLAVGGTAGAAVGLIPAIFTFGLSIPFFATIGAGVGFATGVAVGGTTGAIGGGAVGYGAYQKRDTISAFLSQAWAKVKGAKDTLCATAMAKVGGAKA